MPATNTFHNRCEALFARKLGYGRRWKTAAARALRIGRATLYRCFDEDSGVPQDVLARLERLDAGEQPIRDDRQMLCMLARGLLDVQRQMDEHGWLKEGYPPTLQRSFDLAAARNVLEDEPRWPTDFGALATWRRSRFTTGAWRIPAHLVPVQVHRQELEGGPQFQCREADDGALGVSSPQQDELARTRREQAYALVAEKMAWHVEQTRQGRKIIAFAILEMAASLKDNA